MTVPDLDEAASRAVYEPNRRACPGVDLLRNLLIWILCAIAIRAPSARCGELSQVADARAVQLTLPDLEGRQRSLSEFAGKWVLLNFWASWCTPCLQEMPGIQRLAKQMANKPFAVIAVNVAEPQRRVQTTVKRLGLDFPVLLDTESSVFDSWGATVLPTTYLLDGSGRMRYVGRGPLEWDGAEITAIIEQLLSNDKGTPP